MKWNDVQITQLKCLCYAKKSNREIAENLGCNVSDVYGKRSQLGITIEKVNGIKVELKKPNNRIAQSLDRVYDSLLVDMARDETTIEEAQEYGLLLDLFIEFKKFYRVIRNRPRGDWSGI